MDGRAGTGIGCEPWAAASAGIAAVGAGVRWNAGRLADIRRHAISVSLLPWESPAGNNFRTYLAERCAELSRTIDLLEAAARELDDYGRLIRAAEVLHHEAGL